MPSRLAYIFQATGEPGEELLNVSNSNLQSGIFIETVYWGKLMIEQSRKEYNKVRPAQLTWLLYTCYEAIVPVILTLNMNRLIRAGHARDFSSMSQNLNPNIRRNNGI